MKVRLLVVIALFALLLVPSAAGVMRPQTTEPTDVINIRVTITDSRMKLSRTVLERGVIIRFNVRNLGRKVHDFTFGDAGNVGGFVTTGPLRHNQRKVVLVFVDIRGTWPYSSSVRADANKPGLKGRLTIH